MLSGKQLHFYSVTFVWGHVVFDVRGVHVVIRHCASGGTPCREIPRERLGPYRPGLHMVRKIYCTRNQGNAIRFERLGLEYAASKALVAKILSHNLPLPRSHLQQNLRFGETCRSRSGSGWAILRNFSSKGSATAPEFVFSNVMVVNSSIQPQCHPRRIELCISKKHPA